MLALASASAEVTPKKSRPKETAIETTSAPVGAVARMQERRQVVILFCDLCGFTKLSESLDPEEVSNIIHPLFEILSHIIHDYKGSIEKFIGDAIMALFGVPISYEDDPERALIVALKMQQAIHDYSSKINHDITMRIGLNVGTVVSGQVSYGGDKPDYTVIGDAVNTAARVEQHTPKGSILVTKGLYELTQGRFIYRDHPAIDAKGKAEPIETFELLGIQKLRQAHRGSLDMPVVGRNAEIALLETQSQQLFAQKPIAVGFWGDAGIGKSRLFYELQTQLETKLPLRSYRAFSVSYTQHASLSLLRQILKHLLGLAESDAIEHVESQLRGHLRMLPGFGELQCELLLQLLFPERQSDILQYQSADVLQKQWYKVLAEFIIKMSQAQPMLLILEDLQWTDAPSLAWLDYFLNLLKTTSNAALFLGATWRPLTEDVPIDFTQFGWDLTKELLPLDDASSKELFCTHLELTSIPKALIPLSERLIERGHGNPYYIEESLRILKEEALQLTETGWELTVDLEALPLPNSLQRLILSKFDRLDSDLRELLQVASVAGHKFSKPLLLAALEISEPHLDALIQTCLEQDYWQQQKTSYSFSKAMMRETIYETLLMRRRRELHQKIGTYLETSDAWPADIFDRLAHHFIRAKNTLKALRYLFIAGELGARFFAHQTALGSYRKAIAILDQKELPAETLIAIDPASKNWINLAQLERKILLSEIDIYWLTGEYKQALTAIENALKHSTERFFQVSVYLKQGKCFEKMSRWDDALKAYASGEKHLENNTHTLEMAQLKNAEAWTFYRQGHYEAAQKSCQQALLILDSVPDMKELAYAFNVTGVIHYHQQAWEDALAAYEKSLNIQEQIYDMWGQGNSWSNMGSVYLMTQRLDQAEKAFLKSLDLRESLGDLTGVATSCNNLGHIYQELKQPETAVAYLQRSLEIYAASGNRLGEAISLCNLGTALQLSQQLIEAENQLEKGITLLKELDVKQILPEAMNGLAEVLLTQKKTLAAHDVLTEIEQLLSHDPTQTLRFYRLSGWRFVQQKKFGEAKAIWQKALELRKPEEQAESKKLYELLQKWASKVNLQTPEHWNQQLELLIHL